MYQQSKHERKDKFFEGNFNNITSKVLYLRDSKTNRDFQEITNVKTFYIRNLSIETKSKKKETVSFHGKVKENRTY